MIFASSLYAKFVNSFFKNFFWLPCWPKFSAAAMIFSLTVLQLGTGVGLAQDSLRIAAIVNDDAISVYDLESRLTLFLRLSNIPDSTKSRKYFGPIVLRNLIDESIKRSEAKRAEIEVSQKELEARMVQFEKEHKISSGMLERHLKNIGLGKATVEEKVETDIAWIKLVQRFFGPKHTVTDQEIDDVITDIEKNKGKPEFLVSEIFLASADKSKETSVTAQGLRLLNEIRNGAPFRAIARNFSQSASAAVGGDLGWVRLNHVEKPLAQLLSSLKPGHISNLTKVVGGYKIILLRKKRVTRGRLDERTKSSSIVSLYQMLFPIPRNTSSELIKTVRNGIREKTRNIRSCAAMEKTAKNNKLSQHGPLGPINEERLASKLRSLISNLADSTPSQPILVKNGLLVAMVCNRKTSNNLDPETRYREAIRNKLFEKRLLRSAQKHLRDLRRSAFIDIRI
tara:strand:- start:573 stop:1934 length:1362 start_codon:yes stop_codon:yes gene_type:complete